MEEKLNEMKQKIKKVDKLFNVWDMKIEIDEITSVDEKLLKQLEEVWEDVLEICQNEKINDMDKFDKKYPIFKYGLDEFIQDYSDVLGNAVDISDEFLDEEIKLLTQVNENFILDKQTKNDNELLIIRDNYLLGNQKEAEKEIEKWIGDHPSIGDGYEVKCDWELSKEKPDMNKVAKILDEAQKNKTFVPNEDIYELVIEYFKDIGNDEKAKHYDTILKEEEERLYEEFDKNFGIDRIEDDFELDFEDEEFFEDDDFDYEDEEFDDEELDDIFDLEDEELEDEELDDIFDYEDEEFDDQEAILKERQILIREIKRCAKDEVEKNKTTEEYFSEKTKQELTSYLGPQAIFYTIEEMKESQKNIKKYMLKNYKEIMKNNLIYMPQRVVDEIGKIPFHGIIEKNLEKCTTEQLYEVQGYILLKQLGMAFISHKNNKLTIHVPLIKTLNEFLGDNEVIEKRKEFEEKVNVVKGICELHGALKVKKVFHIMNEFFGEMNRNDFAKFLLLVVRISSKVDIKINYANGNLQFIYNNYISEEMAKEIIKENKEIIKYSKDEYLKYSSIQFLRDTKGYKRIENQLYSKVFMEDVFYEMIDAIIMPYTIEVRIGGKHANEIVDMIIEQVKQIGEKMGDKNIIDIDEMKKGFNEIAKEFPKWKK